MAYLVALGFGVTGSVFGKAAQPVTSGTAQRQGSQNAVEGGPPAPVVAQLQTLRARIAAHPNDDVALTQLADMYLAANHFEEAIPLYRRALRANPHNVAAQTGLAQARQATLPVNVFISCDMEGTAGVCSWKQCDPSDAHEYPTFRRHMTLEVRAAIDGAREAGARRLIVNDSHWSMRNLLLDELPDDDDLRVVSGAPKPWSMMQGLRGGLDAVFFTGYHAKAGDCATLSHTFSESIYAVTVNGTPCSEALLNAALAGSQGVPLVLITGDRTIVDETTRVMPWVVGVAVKDAIGFSSVNSLMPQAACDAIRAGAREAIGRVDRARPFVFNAPFELTIETASVEHADFIELMPGFARIGGRALGFTSSDYPPVLEAFIAATRMAAAANSIA